MADVLKNAADWLAGQLKTSVGQSITYVRGDERIPLTATIGRTLFDQPDDHGVMLRVESRDYLVQAADLVIDGAAVLPERDDQIEEEQGGKVYVYDVLAPGDEPAWRWSDPYRTVLRIHTKQAEARDA